MSGNRNKNDVGHRRHNGRPRQSNKTNRDHKVSRLNENLGQIPRVFWAKTGSSYWPARRCTEIEVKEWTERERLSGKSTPEKKDSLRITFFGSFDHGFVTKSSFLPFGENDRRLRSQKKGKRFKLALEQAEAAVLQENQGISPDDSCVVCGRKEGDPAKVLICDRCHRGVHMGCCKLSSVPDGDWFCPPCVVEAPISWQFSEEENARLRQEKKNLTVKISKNGVKRKRYPIILKFSAKNGSISSKQSQNDDLTRSLSVPSSNPDMEILDENYDETCFICKQSGDGHDMGFILCEFKGCTRIYHYNCLGNAAPILSNDLIRLNSESNTNRSRKRKSPSSVSTTFLDTDSSKWICPWHYCGVCGDVEVEDDSPLNHVLPTSSSLKILTRRCSQTRGDIAFARCVGCPFSVCREHLSIPRFVQYMEESVMPAQILREIDNNGFFSCLGCQRRSRCRLSERDSDPKLVKPPNALMLGKILLNIWSNLANKRYKLLEPFLQAPDDYSLALCIADTSLRIKVKQILESKLKSRKVICLMDVRSKVLTGEYGSVNEFEEDIHQIADLISMCYSNKMPQIDEAAQTLKVLLPRIRLEFETDLSKFPTRLEKLIETFDEQEGLTTLFPSLDRVERMLIKGNIGGISNKPKSFSPDNWIDRLTKSVLEKNSAAHLVSDLTSSTGLDVLFQASEIIDQNSVSNPSAFDLNGYVPAHKILHDLSDHESNLRSLLDGLQRLKDTVEENQRHISGVKHNGKPVSLGELGLAAEYRLENRQLQAQNKILKNSLIAEKTHRKTLEDELKQLKAIDQPK